MTIIDTHAHLWLHQEAEVEQQTIQSLTNGRSLFMGEIRQMMPPYMIDGVNSAEILLSNMDYAQVGGAVITQEYIDGNQNEYLLEVSRRYPNRFKVCGLCEFRRPGFLEEAHQVLEKGFSALKIPAQRLITTQERTWLNNPEMMELFKIMEENQIILSIDLAEGDTQVKEMEEIIQEYPSLKIAIGHFGMVTHPQWEEQIKLARYPNVNIESGGITWLFHKEFYPYFGAIKAIRRAIELVGVNKLMWGSDYPRTMTAITYRMSYDFIQKTPLLSQVEKSKFLGENAAVFYNFNQLPQLNYIKNMLED